MTKLTLLSPEIQSELRVLRFDHTFELKEQADWLAFSVNYGRCNGFYLLVIDPDGRIRIQYHGKREDAQLLLSRNGAGSSCGSVPGELPSGQWQVQIIAYTKSHPVQYRIDIAAGNGDPESVSSLPETGEILWSATEYDGTDKLCYPHYDWHRSYGEGRRWYKGDFHMHTLLSDGKQTARQLNDLALSQKLDFIVITEHNIMTAGWPDSPLLVIPGIEYTSSLGHFNALGIRNWIDISGDVSNGGVVDIESQTGMNRILEEARSQGAVCSLNHPLLEPWHWQWGATRLELFDVIELWNDPTYPGNAEATDKALKMWDKLWSGGHLIWGIGGSDTHLLPTESYTDGGAPSIVGDPLTCVWSDQLSAEAILHAVRNGHCYVTRGPILEPWVRDQRDHLYLPGEKLGTTDPSGTVLYEVEVKNAPEGAVIQWIMDGAACETQQADGDRTYTCSLEWNSKEFHWLRLEVRDADNRLLAFVNPIYSGSRDKSLFNWSELFSDDEMAGASS